MIDMRFHRENLTKHNVSPDEVEEAFFDKRGWTERAIGGAYKTIGKTFAGRILELVYRKVPNDSIFVFHAMDARDHQKKRYKRLNK